MPRLSMLIDNTCPNRSQTSSSSCGLAAVGWLVIAKSITELKFGYAELPDFFQAFVQDSYLLMLIHL